MNPATVGRPIASGRTEVLSGHPRPDERGYLLHGGHGPVYHRKSHGTIGPILGRVNAVR